jgi:hypothetical protein
MEKITYLLQIKVDYLFTTAKVQTDKNPDNSSIEAGKVHFHIVLNSTFCTALKTAVQVSNIALSYLRRKFNSTMV